MPGPTLVSRKLATPRWRVQRVVLQREVANPANPPSDCYFHPRCTYALEICRTQAPAWEEVSQGHFVRCHRARELQLSGVEGLENAPPQSVPL